MNWPERLRAETASGRANCALAELRRAQARRIGAHLDIAIGPGAVLGSQRGRLGKERGINSIGLLRWWPLRAEDGSRSVSWQREPVCFEERNIELLFLRGRFR